MDWFKVENVNDILSPALAVYPERIRHNIDEMIRIAGSSDRLRPHVKTYKMPQIVEMQMDLGISKFKCATLVEAEMLISAGCSDILLAMPTVGPAQKMILELKRNHPHISISALIDHPSQITSWKNEMIDGESIDLFIDINVGMSRTGIDPSKAQDLYNLLSDENQFNIRGLHVYDGHNRISDFDNRNEQVDKEFKDVQTLLTKIDNSDLEIVCGGSVTFPCHALDSQKTLSPGTTLLWDAGYGTQFTDIEMQNAAVLICRVISMPGEDRICLDLGHKSVASEMSNTRVIFPQLSDYRRVGHSEEHLVLQLKDRSNISVGDVLYGIPWHICPTVALHAEVVVVDDHKAIDFWPVAARHRKYRTA
jgi:D-serine deaminase-like pyridoxal phosphate-dependent protein